MRIRPEPGACTSAIFTTGEADEYALREMSLGRVKRGMRARERIFVGVDGGSWGPPRHSAPGDVISERSLLMDL